MSEISIFNKYHTKENAITNYCWLMLKLLYEASPKSFEQTIVDLIEDDKPIFVEPIFLQQKRVVKEDKKENKKISIADLTIRQQEFELTFEVKTHDRFYEGQFDKYIDNLKWTEIKKNKVLFALTNEFSGLNKFESIKDKAKENWIIFQAITFSNLVESIEKNKTNDELFSRFLNEFKMFLDNEWLFESWQTTLDVVNCSWSIDEVKEWYYVCPAVWGSHKHKRCKYFWAYKNKKVEMIFEIDAVLIVNRKDNKIVVENLLYKNTDIDDKELKKRAKNIINNRNSRIDGIFKDNPLQVFLLSNKKQTNFYKESKWWLFWSKIYFSLPTNIKNIEELAEKLNDLSWEEFQTHKF